MNKITIIQTVVPAYRKRFFQELSTSLHSSFELYSGSTYFDESIKTDSSITHNQLKNVYFFGRKLLWQRGVAKMANYEATIILELNPRILTNWLLLFKRRCRNRKTILWGHAFPRSGKNSTTEIFRKFMRSLSSGIIAYSEEQKNALESIHTKKPIFAAPNAIYSALEMQPATNKPYDIIFTGRFITEKKVLCLLTAFHKTLSQLPAETRLILIGNGPSKKLILQTIQKLNLQTKIVILDSIYDRQELEKYYSNALVAVCPGTAGLFLIQAMSFGLPVVVSKSEKHGPEIEILKEYFNGFYFESNDTEDFARLLLMIYKDREEWVNKRESISEHCRKTYSVEKMSQTFINLNHQF